MNRAKKRRVLVADDSITIQKLVNLTLAGTDFEVITALDGYDASMKVKRMKPEVVLIDAELREVSGADLCRTIKEEGDLDETKIILMRGNITSDEAAEIQADVTLDKPFDSKLLLNAINNLMMEEETTRVRAPESIVEPTVVGQVDQVEEHDEEPTKNEAPPTGDGPFSSFSQAEQSQAPEPGQLSAEDSPFQPLPRGGDDLSEQLASIAHEVTSRPGVEAPVESMEETEPQKSDEAGALDSDSDFQAEVQAAEQEAQRFQEEQDRSLWPDQESSVDAGAEAQRGFDDAQAAEETKIVVPSPASSVSEVTAEKQLDMDVIEKIARDEIRQWIDQNLPEMVESLLKEELAKAADSQNS